MYIAMLAFAKSALISAETTAVNLCLYRCAVLFVIESIKMYLFPDSDNKDSLQTLKEGGDRAALAARYKEYYSPMYKAWLDK